MKRRTVRTPKKAADFLAALRTTGNVTLAAEAAVICRTSVYEWRDADPEFAAAWRAAQELGTDALEDEALRRAHQGTTRPVFYEGQECGQVREYSDTLLIFMLKARRPDKFKDRTQLLGDADAPLKLGVVMIPSKADQ